MLFMQRLMLSVLLLVYWLLLMYMMLIVLILLFLMLLLMGQLMQCLCCQYTGCNAATRAVVVVDGGADVDAVIDDNVALAAPLAVVDAYDATRAIYKCMLLLFLLL